MYLTYSLSDGPVLGVPEDMRGCTQCAASNSISHGTAFRNSANNVRLIIRKLSALTIKTELVRPRDGNSSSIHDTKVEFSVVEK